MIKLYKIFFLIIFVILTSCSSENKKISIIEESDLELQMIEAYKEGYEELEKGDVIYAAKNLMRQNFYTHNLSGLQKQFYFQLMLIILKIIMIDQFKNLKDL